MDQITQLKGISNVNVFGAGQYAMRFWVKPDQLATLNLTVNDILTAINAQNTVNPAGLVGGPPTPHGQEFTYAITAQGRLVSEEEFGQIIIRENPDGSIVRLKDVARVELGAQLYNMVGKLNGKPSAVLAIYQLPDSNALDDQKAVLKLLAKLKQSFPDDLDYVVSLDTTLAISEGMHDILRTLVIALILVLIVVFIFLQGWRASLIPLARRAGVADRHHGIFPHFRIFAEHPFTLWFGAGHWVGGGRRHRGRRSHRTSHRRGHDAQRRRAQGDAGSGRPGRFPRAHSRGRFYSDHFHCGHHRTTLPAIRADHCHFRHAVGI